MGTGVYHTNKVGGDLIGNAAIKQSIGNIDKSVVIGANCNITINIVVGGAGNTTAIIGNDNTDSGNITLSSEQLIKLLADTVKNLITTDKELVNQILKK